MILQKKSCVNSLNLYSVISVYSEIYERIEKCLDQKGLEKKQARILDRKYIEKQTNSLIDEPEESCIEYSPENLETGRPRITAEEVFIFICLRAYLDSVTDQEAVERMVESQSLYIYYTNRNKKMPKPKTINENLNCIDSETLEFIHRCQLNQFLNEGLDDFNYAVFDSTSVEASSSWPTDAAVISRLFVRIQIQSQKLESYGIINIWFSLLKDILKIAELFLILSQQMMDTPQSWEEKVV